MSRALVIVDHGSRLPAAHAHLERPAARVAALAPDWRVCVAHLELRPPSIDEAIDACVKAGADEVQVHPLFLAPGRHLTVDLPARVDAAAARHPRVKLRVTRALGESEGLAEMILRAATEA